MDLSNCTLLPGVVVDAEDPENLGRVKCVVAGVNDPNTMNSEHFFWTAPLMSFGYQRISRPMEGQKVWILSDKTNYYESYYIPAWELNINTSAIAPEDDYDVLVSRSGTGYGAQSYYTGSEGFVTRIGTQTEVNIQDNIITQTDGTVESSVKDGHVYAGKVGGDYEPSVKGETLYGLLQNLQQCLEVFAMNAGANPYVADLSTSISDCARAISSDIDRIKCDSSFVN